MHERSSPNSFGKLDGMQTGLTFDDVLLVPKYSEIKSRKDVSTGPVLTEKIGLSIPIVSANMDTVTEADMAIAIAREGGIGIIHRFMSLEQQLAQVSKVKRTESIIIESPYTLRESSNVAEVRRLMSERNVGGILIVSGDGKLKGIVTTQGSEVRGRAQFESQRSHDQEIDLVVAPKRTSPEKAKEIMRETKIEKTPARR